MKKSILLFSILLFVGSIVFQSCKKDDGKNCTSDSQFEGVYTIDHPLYVGYVVTFSANTHQTSINGTHAASGTYNITSCDGDDFSIDILNSAGQGGGSIGHFENADRFSITDAPLPPIYYQRI